MSRRKSPQAPKGLTRRARVFTDSLRRHYAPEIAADPQGFKRSVVRLIRLALPPGPGRPADEAVTRAAKMRAQGTPWLEIYRECIPHFAELDNGIRQLPMLRLRAAVRSRRHARQRKKARPQSQRQESCV